MKRRMKQIVYAIADGMDSKIMRTELMELENKAEAIEALVNLDKQNQTNVIDIHPRLPALYEKKVKDLRNALQQGNKARSQAMEALRAMITDIVVKPGKKRGEVLLELHGSIPAVLAFASAKKRRDTDSLINHLITINNQGLIKHTCPLLCPQSL